MDDYLKDLLKVLAFAAAVATIPLIAAFARLQPPWPPAIEYVSAVFIMMAALVMWEWGRAAKRTKRRGLIIAGMALTILGIGSYLPLYSLFVQNVANSEERVIRGTQCTRDAQLVYKDACPSLPPDALPSAEWNADYLWTSGSIMRVRLALVAAWLFFTAGLVAFVGAAVAGRRMSREKKIARRRT